MKYTFIAIFLGLILCSCEPSAEVGKGKATKGFSKSDIIRMPVSANQPVDTTLVAKMDFEETTHQFGTIQEGRVVEHIFKFTNTGKIPLVISDAKATCGCTIPSFPKEPILPGDEGEVSVKFNSGGKKHDQSKPVTLIANTYPAKTVLFMKGFVLPAKKN